MKTAYFLVVSLCFSVSGIHAGTFWFPIEGHYSYSSNLMITAVPDLNRNSNAVKTRLWQTGVKDSQSITVNGLKGFVKKGGGDWEFDGVRYTDDVSGTGKKYLWYDNHNGYDFITLGKNKHPSIHAVESGTTCGFIAQYGQLCIEHTIGRSVYRTYYTHMSNIPSELKAKNGLNNAVYKWQYLGKMSNVSKPSEPVGVHLHFTTRKLVGMEWVVVDPYGHKPYWPYSTEDDPENPYLWE